MNDNVQPRCQAGRVQDEHKHTMPLDDFGVTCYEKKMKKGRPLKTTEPLTESLNTKVSIRTKHRIHTIAINRSTAGAIVQPSDVVREALDIGLATIEDENQDTPTND